MTKVTTEYFGEINFFPYEPQAPMSELLEWNSSVTNSIDGTEDRDSNVEEPSQTLEMTFPLDSEKKRDAFNSLYGAIRETWYFPLWAESQYVGDITDNQTEIDCNTILYNFNLTDLGDTTGVYSSPVEVAESIQGVSQAKNVAGNDDYIYVSTDSTISTFDTDGNFISNPSIQGTNKNFYCDGNSLYFSLTDSGGFINKYTIETDGSLTKVYTVDLYPFYSGYNENACCVYDGIIYSDGHAYTPGTTLLELDADTGAGITQTSLSGMSHGIRGIAVDDDYIYIADCDIDPCDMRVRKYDKTTKAIIQSAPLMAVLSGHQSLALENGVLLLTYGETATTGSSGIVVINPDDMTVVETHLMNNYDAFRWGNKYYTCNLDAGTARMIVYDFAPVVSSAGLGVARSGNNYQLVEITGTTPGSITVDSVDAMSSAYLMPVKRGIIVGDVAHNTGGFSATDKIKFLLNDNLDFSESTPAQYLGDDVYYDIVPEKTGDMVQKKIMKDQLLANFKLGPVDVSSYWTNSRVGFPFKKTLYSHSDVYDFRGFLYRRAGRYRQFWSPSFEHDLKCVSDGLIQSEMLVQSDSIIDYVQARDHIVVVDTDGNHYPRAITSFLQVDSDRVELTLSSSLGLYDYEISSVSFMGIYRLNSDKIKIKWNTNNIAIAAAGLVEIEP